jgi:hypothetical protein
MTFLYGSNLTREIKRLCEEPAKIDLAVAYWGSRALDILALDPTRSNVRVICCLRGGKSAPEVVERFGERARQRDDLHAKVIWTESAAIVSSANASSNGLPDEEDLANGLLEAGVFVDDQSELKRIGLWFDKLFTHESDEITAADLKLAALARHWGSKEIPSLTELIVSMRGRVPSQIPITLAIYSDEGTKKQARAIEKSKLKEKEEIMHFLNINDDEFNRLDWYVNWSDLPADEFLIDCFVEDGKITAGEFLRSFGKTKEWKTKFGDEYDTYHFVKRRGPNGPRCKLTRDDRRLIRDCSTALREEAEKYNGLLGLTYVAKILFDHITKGVKA